MAPPSDNQPSKSTRLWKEGDTAPLQVAREYMESIGIGGTAGLPGAAKANKPLTDRVRLYRNLGNAISQAERVANTTEPRVELLVHALRSRGIAIPGVSDWQLKHALSANGKNIIVYLEKRFQHVPALAQQVQVACFRHHELAAAVLGTRAAVETEQATEAMLEDLRLKTYFVTHFHDHFKSDPLLRQLFPPPEVSKEKTAPIGTDAITRYRQARDACGRRAEGVYKTIAAGLDRPRRLLGLAKQDRGSALLGLLNPNDMRERQVVKKLRDTGHLASMEELVGLVDKIPAMMSQIKEGAPFEPLEELLELVLGAYDRTCTDAVAKELLPVVPGEFRMRV